MSSKVVSVSRRGLLKLGAATALAAAMPFAAHAEKQNLASGVAIQGYDPVAYFTENAAVQGDAAISTEYEGATYNFASTENRDAFLASPAKYAPQYGGFCAFAVSKGYTAPIDPAAFSVVEDKLYLNFSKGVRSTWSKDIAGNIERGDKNWPELSKN